jgi:hypothetical protein
MDGQLTKPPSAAANAQTKEKKMPNGIITFLKGRFRVLTNNPTPKEEEAYNSSQESNKPVPFSRIKTVTGHNYVQDIYAVQTGDYTYSLLENKLTKRGIKFRLGVVSNDDLSELINKYKLFNLKEMIGKCRFAWANASYTFFLEVEDSKEASSFDLSDLGLEVYDFKKTSKRLQEVTRITQMHASGPMDKLNYRMLEDLPGEELAYDGPVFVSDWFALRSCFRMANGPTKAKHFAMINRGKIGPMIGRILMDQGEVKGLFHVVPREQLGADLVFHKSALKRELKTDDGRWHYTAFKHKNLHTAMWDMQTMFNNHTWLMTKEQFTLDMESVITDFNKSIENGQLPDWIIHQETDGHKDDSAPQVEHVTSSWKKSYIRWQQAGLDVTASSNLVYMAFGSLLNQMRSAMKRNTWWVPISNAFTATVTTFDALEVMGNFELPQHKRDMVFFDERFGCVVPTKRFIETADLHDTWDQDGDQAKFIRIKLWSSSPVMSLDGYNHPKLRETYVIPADLEVPSTPEEAIDMCVVIRSPNGPGGYSIERFDAETMPWLRVAEDRVQVIDLHKAPAAMSTLLAATECGQINSSTTYTEELFNRDHAINMINAQMSNPGVGRYANLIMVWAATFGPSYPSKLPAIGNDVIDCVQQTADLDAFLQLQGDYSDMAEYMAQEIINSGCGIDRYVLETRFPALSDETREMLASVAVDGKFTEMYNAYKETLTKVQNLASKGSFELRLSSDTRNKVYNGIPALKESTSTWCRAIWSKYERELSRVDAKYSDLSKNTNRFTKMFAVAQRAEDISAIVGQLLDEVKATSHPELYALAIYRWIIDPELTRSKYGVSDRIIFQNGADGQETIMDLIITAIKDLN